jgi:hypothetical protein
LSDEEEVEFLDNCEYSERHLKQQIQIVKILEQYKSPLEVSEVSDAMIRGISYSSTDKIYDSELGTSCHQCR